MFQGVRFQRKRCELLAELVEDIMLTLQSLQGTAEGADIDESTQRFLEKLSKLLDDVGGYEQIGRMGENS